MRLETLFSLASALALAGWLMLALAPLRRGRPTSGGSAGWAVTGVRGIAAILCGGYAVMLVTGLAGGEPLPPGAGFDSLAAVRLLLSTPAALLAGWVHYLAFDLFIGSWEAEDAPAARIPHGLLLPCLALTFVAGPVGLLLYLVIKASRRQ